jgi:hypothetical protein
VYFPRQERAKRSGQKHLFRSSLAKQTHMDILLRLFVKTVWWLMQGSSGKCRKREDWLMLVGVPFGGPASTAFFFGYGESRWGIKVVPVKVG